MWACSILGAVLIVAGLYSVLWGKYKEYQAAEDEAIPEAIKGGKLNGEILTILEDNDDIEKQKAEANKLTAFILKAPVITNSDAPKI